MEKKVKYGFWRPCKEGAMPEDLLGYTEINKIEITDSVLIPHVWGNGDGAGEYYAAHRIRHKGNKKWKWYPCESAKPLFWMPIPKIPTKLSVCCLKNMKMDV